MERPQRRLVGDARIEPWLCLLRTEQVLRAVVSDGVKPQVEKEHVLLFHHPQIVEGVQLPADRKPMEGFPVSHGKRFDGVTNRRTPPTDYLGVIAMLKSPARIAVMLGEKLIAERELPAGVTSWLIYQPRISTIRASSTAAIRQRFIRRRQADFLVTTLDKPFWDAEVYVAVYRGGDRGSGFSARTDRSSRGRRTGRTDDDRRCVYAEKSNRAACEQKPGIHRIFRTVWRPAV